jgi:hypothetical protein
MNTFKRIISYSPYLLLLLVVFPVFAGAQDAGIFSIKGILWSFVNNVFGFLIGAGGVVLDFAVNEYVIGFGETWGIGGTGVGGAIDLTWAIIRDMFNIGFIFGLVWLGFKMILRSDDSNTRRTLITLIIAALLVNFSLFITKFVVDFTNILASEIAESFAPALNADVEISAAFMQLFGLTTVWEGSEGTTVDATSYMQIFGTAIVFMIGAFTFFAGGIMLIIRFAALCIYMVFSPLMFLGFVFPGLQNISRSYWKGFLGRAFFAPAYLMLVYLSAYVMGSYNSSASGFADAFSGENADAVAASIGPFLLVSVFLIASVVVAGKMSTTGASTVLSVGNNIRGRAQRVVKNTANRAGGVIGGTGRFATRQTVGRGARGVSNVAERTRRKLDRGLSSMSQKGGNWKGAARTLDRTLGSGLRSAENASVAGSETKAQQRTRVNEQNARLNTVGQQTERNNDIAAALALAQANKPNADMTNEEQETARKTRMDALNTISNQVRRMGNDEVLNLSQKTIESPEFAQHLTDSHIQALRESGKYTNKEAGAISTARDTGMIDTTSEALDSTNASTEELNSALDQLTQNIQSMPIERLSSMKAETLATQRVASNLTEAQLEGMKNSGRFTASDITNIRAARENGLGAIASGSAPEIANIENAENHSSAMRKRGEKLFQGNAQTAGQLPASVYTKKEMVSNITPSALQQRVRNGLSDGDAATIEANINEYLTSRAASEGEKRAWRNWSEKSTEGARFNFTA